MGFISSLFGDNQKINIGNLESDINQALEPAMAGYKNLRLKGVDMQNRDSAFNLGVMNDIRANTQDDIYNMNRAVGRGLTNVPAAVRSAQFAANANTAMDMGRKQAEDAFRANMAKGIEIESGAINNLADMGMNKLDRIQAAQQANQQLASQSAGAKASLLGTGLDLAADFIPGGGLLKKGLSLFSQEGCMVDDDDIEYMMMGGKIKGYQEGGEADFEPHLMFDKEGKGYMANTYDEHLKYKKMGYMHKKDMQKMMMGGMAKKKYGYQEGGSALKPIPEGNKGLSKLPEEVRNKMGYMKKGGYIYGQEGGMLSQVMGPNGPMAIGTRMGGIKIG